MKLPVALTIAGSDSGGGAGIQADLKTFAALGVHGTSAITAITAQNTLGVTAIQELPVHIIRAQIDAVVADLAPAAAKTGMISSVEIIETVARAVREHGISNLVVDPVMVAKGGAKLLQDDAVDALRRLLLPLAAVVTPNLPEAEVLLGHPVSKRAEQRAAAREILALGPRAVVVKGGHAGGTDSTDFYLDAERELTLAGERFATTNTHGSGCVFSAAIAAELSKGAPLAQAVTSAKAFVSAAIETSLELGHGHGPVNPMFRVGAST